MMRYSRVRMPRERLRAVLHAGSLDLARLAADGGSIGHIDTFVNIRCQGIERRRGFAAQRRHCASRIDKNPRQGKTEAGFRAGDQCVRHRSDRSVSAIDDHVGAGHEGSIVTGRE